MTSRKLNDQASSMRALLWVDQYAGALKRSSRYGGSIKMEFVNLALRFWKSEEAAEMAGFETPTEAF